MSDLSLSDRLRESLGHARAARATELSEARAILRKHRIRNEAELLVVLDNLLGSIDITLVGTDLEEFKERLIELTCELENALDAPNHPKCPTYSVKRYSGVMA